MADFIMIIDGTFNTNALRLPLFAAVGISNSNSTFPLAFSYYPSESEDAIGFFFDSLKEMVFLKGTQGPPAGIPKVVLGDQAAGLISAMPKYLKIVLDKHAFSYLKGSVSLDALKRIDAKWQFITQQVAATNGAINLGPCECELLYRFGLPCKHHLLRAT